MALGPIGQSFGKVAPVGRFGQSLKPTGLAQTGGDKPVVGPVPVPGAGGGGIRMIGGLIVKWADSEA